MRASERGFPYGVVVARDVAVPMRDGVRLATDVYRPGIGADPAPGRFPVVLSRTPYDKTSPLVLGGLVGALVPRGFVVAVQDLRGRHGSEGSGDYFHVANPREGQDGHDAIEWLAAQSWSNGRVGMTGSSHGGTVQVVAALHRPPHLAAVWPDVAPTDLHAHCCREGGAMALHMFAALFLHAHDAQELRSDPVGRAVVHRAMERMRELVFELPRLEPGTSPLAPVPGLERVLFDYYRRGADDAFWRQECCAPGRYLDRHAGVPAMLTGGWYDPFSAATTAQFEALSRRSRSAARLVMGPWTHGGMRNGSTASGDVEFGPSAAWGPERYDAERLAWFERWLSGVEIGIDRGPPVRIFVMGGGSGRRTAEGRLDHGGAWRDEDVWPVPRATATPFFLRAGGRLTREPPPADDPPARFDFDPAHPVPTISGNVCGFFELLPLPPGFDPRFVPPRLRMRSVVLEGGAHQREAPGIVGARPPWPLLADRADVLVFQTEPLARPVEVVGPVSVRLWIASSAPDTDFTAKLLDVYPPNEDYPDGYHLNLVDSIRRVRFRDSPAEERLLAPGEVAAIEIALPPTANRFERGHRIRLDVSGSNFPRFDVNPNTGEPLGLHTRLEVATNTVFLDRDRPSHLVVPIVE